MIKVISGKDWSCLNKDESYLSFVVSNNDIDNEQNNDNRIPINPYDYFPVFTTLFGHSDNIKPRNLGVYLDKDWNIHSAQFVGIMPLTDVKLKLFQYKDKQCVIKIDSRFHISPSKMLKEVLEGDDYYENPDMLQCNSYKLSELENLFGKGKKNKVLCGTISDIGKVTLKQSDVVNGDKSNDVDSFLSSVYPIFEIIRFVNLAKEVCKKNLKKQSVFKEENLVGKVKGRILVNQQIKQNISRGQYHKTYCTYNALSENIKENMILKYTLHLCSKFEIADSLREDIMFCNRVLADVPLKKCSISDFVGLKCNGVFRQYKQAMDAAKVIIKRYYISYDQSANEDTSKNEENKKEKIIVTDYSVEPYFIDMNLLFEFYSRALLRKAINNYNQYSNDYMLKMDSATNANISLFGDKNGVKPYYMPTYIPDILIRYWQKDQINDKDGKILTVIDAKYSDVEKKDLEKRPRTHQILFYMNVLDCDFGGLISPNTEDKSCLMDSYLYDGKKKSKQELCYLPLAPNREYDEMISKYLGTIMEKRIETDKKKQKHDELEAEVKEILRMIEKGKTGIKLSVTNNMKNDLLTFYDKFQFMIDNSEENTRGE